MDMVESELASSGMNISQVHRMTSSKAIPKGLEERCQAEGALEALGKYQASG